MESIPQIIPNKLWWLDDLERAWKYRAFKFSVKFDLRLGKKYMQYMYITAAELGNM